MTPRHRTRAREDPWRLFLNLSWTGFAGGLLLALIGAWLAAAITFTLALLSALAAGWRLRRTNPGSAGNAQRPLLRRPRSEERR